MLGSLLDSGAFGKVHQSLIDDKMVFKILNLKFNYKREIKILEKIGDNQCFCKLLNYFEKDKLIYLKFPKYYCNLNQFTKNLESNEVLDITYQVLDGLEYLEFNGIIHCDLKPENIMFETDKLDKVKIIDLGSSIEVGHKNIYNNYIQSRWYCSPDVILGKPLTINIDIWSLGCIVYELFTKKILFPGSKSETNYRVLQLYKIIEIMGIPSENYLKDCKLKNKYFTDKLTLIPKENKYSLIKIFNKEGNEIKIQERNLDQMVNDINILKLIKMLLRYENRLSFECLKNEINDLYTNKKIKL